MSNNNDNDIPLPPHANRTQATMQWVPLESCYCVVCMTCFHCQQPYHRETNSFCKCRDTYLRHIDQTEPANTDIMKKNRYKRAFTIDWIRRHAHDMYYDMMSTSFYLEEGKFLSIPLCVKHGEAYKDSWAHHLRYLADKNISLDDLSEEELNNCFIKLSAQMDRCAYKFLNWPELISETSNSTYVISLHSFPENATRERLCTFDDSLKTSFAQFFQVFLNYPMDPNTVFGYRNEDGRLVLCGPEDSMLNVLRTLRERVSKIKFYVGKEIIESDLI